MLQREYREGIRAIIRSRFFMDLPAGNFPEKTITLAFCEKFPVIS